MMEGSWIFPLTILPGIGMLIMSTTHWATALTNEIYQSLTSNKTSKYIIEKKINQLALVNRTLVLLYICAGLCGVAGFFGALCQQNHFNGTFYMNILLACSIFILVVATCMLITFAYRATKIKQEQFQERYR